MGNTRNTGFLQNAVRVASNGDISLMHGNTMLMQISSSGAITTTGVISGSNALSASYALNATTSSFAVSATSASYALNATTASYADTLTVAGTLTAQTLVVQTITSSVDFVTGSTRFGSLSSNTHVFTGSMSVSGSGTFVGVLSGSSATFTQLGTTTVSVNSINSASYSAFIHAENGVNKSYLEYINSSYTDSTRRNYLEAYNITGGFSVYTANVKALDISTNQAAIFSNTVQSTGQIVYSPTLGYVNTSYQSYAGATTWYVGAGSSGVSIQPFVIGRNLNGNSADFSISSTGVATFSGALNGTSGNFSSFVYVGNGNPLRIYNTGNGDFGNLTFATATGFTFDKGITSTAASGFIGAYSTNPANDTRIGAYWADSSALEMRYNANSAVGYIQSLYENVGGQAFGDIHFRQNVGGTMTTRMIIKNNNGGIGIGTITPNNLLSVRGNADFGATGIAYAGMSQYGALTFPRGQIMWSNTNSQNQLYIVGNAFSNNNGVFAYRNSGQPATAIGLDNGGIAFLTAGNGTADAAISWTSAMGISNAGYVTKPSNPAFRAYYSVNSTWALGSNSTFVFDTTEYNIGSCYNTSNGRFTAPVAGVYQFNFYSIVLGNYQNAAVSFRKNGGAPTSGFNIHFSPYFTSSSWSNVVYTTSLYLNAGDFVFVVNSGSETNYHGDDWSSFSGYLVG
jgi:hypothetical protein